MAREQFYMLLLDQEATLEAIPGMLPRDMSQRRKTFSRSGMSLRRAGRITEDQRTAARIQQLFAARDDCEAVEARASPSRCGSQAQGPKEVRAPTRAAAVQKWEISTR